MKPENPENQNDNINSFRKGKAAYNTYIKYASMGIQMALIIAAFAFLGVKLDEYFGSNPWLTVVLSLSGVALSLYYFIKKVLSEQS
jgi:F0F1-type ATP synthase assembly protein I